MTAWHDMESAPKDRRILIATDTEMYAVRWVKNYVTGDDAWMVAEFYGSDRLIIKDELAKAWTEAPEHPFNQTTIDKGKHEAK